MEGGGMVAGTMGRRQLVREVCLGLLLVLAFVCYWQQTTTGEGVLWAAVYTIGSTGAVVREIQQRLKNWGYYTGNVDGIYGSGTAEAVRFFQQTNGLQSDGIVGSATLAALGITSEASLEDKLLLARLIYGEGRGEPYEGQVSIGAVVLNRVESPDFPDTIRKVIYQKGAFDAVSDGQINLTPNETAFLAAEDALNGWDPTGGALYYWNPATATSPWIWRINITGQIGRHVFGYQ